MSDYSITTYKTHFKKGHSGPAFWNEIPPWTIKEGWHQYFFTTHFTTTWSSPSSIAQPKDDYIFVDQSQGSAPVWIVSSSHWWGKFYDPAFLQSADYEYNQEWENYHWRRNYNGVFSAHLVRHTPSSQNILFAISHGENKNEKIGRHLYQNSVRTDFLIDRNNPSTFSGGKPYQDCWDAYFGFLNGNWIRYNKQSKEGGYFNDIGPLAWPSAGYLTPNGEQASKGLRHPSSIIHGDYLYIYVIDESMDGKGGVKLIRSRVDELLDPNAYKTWSIGGWLPALPEGFRKEDVSRYFKIRGPDNTPVFAPDKNTIRFAVAKIRDSENFIGVEEYIMGGGDNTIKVAFRLSKDLINWSDRIEFYSGKNWAISNLRYPVFLNREGTSNTEVDLQEFYLLGSSASGVITKLHFNFSPPTSPTSGSPGWSASVNLIGMNNSGNTSKLDDINVFPVPAFYTIDVRMEISTASTIAVNLRNAKGAKIRTLLNEFVNPQLIVRTFDVSNLKAGVYMIEFIQNDERTFRRVIKL